MSFSSEYKPKYHDVHVTFHGPEQTGQATVHYEEAGDPHLPTLLLLHGFPSSSYEFRDFIPLLHKHFHILAPDFPGFGLTRVGEDFTYSFANLTAVIAAWLLALQVSKAAIYVHDYGAPVGLRLAVSGALQVSAIVTQNGNAYKQGFGQDFWAPIFALWTSANSASAQKTLRDNVLVLGATKYQYVQGTPEHDLSLLDPEAWHFNYLQNIAGESNTQHQLALLYDYRTNVELYPAFQKYFRDSKVPILAVWGKNDPAFIPAGAEAFKTDSPHAIVRFVDAGHFALESARWEIADATKEFLKGVKF